MTGRGQGCFLHFCSEQPEIEMSITEVETAVGGTNMGKKRKFSLNMLSFVCFLGKGMGISSMLLDQSL